MKNKIPKFKDEKHETDFWRKCDSTGYIYWTKAKRAIFPKLQPSVRTISLRLPVLILEELKMLANKRDIPYQSLLKIFLAERIEREMKTFLK
jgi:predicted DNA binding CopG/RHH family protein